MEGAVTAGDVATAVAGRVVGDPSTVITDVTHDSRTAAPGALFACIPGAIVDGHDFAPAAVEAGAAALLVGRELALDITQVVVGDVRAATGPAAAECHHHPSRTLQVVGVTGTNGKTTTVHLLGAVFEAAGRPARTIGTLTGARTTPEGPDLQRTLAQWRDDGVAAVAMEVSSHALALRRVDGMHFAAAVFTVMGRDHLEFHSTPGAYFAAKARLFQPDLTEHAVVNGDDPHGQLLADAATIPTTVYRLSDASDLTVGPDATTFTWRGQPVRLSLAGRFNVTNALAAATTAVVLGIAPAVVAEGLSGAAAVPGRFELVPGPQPFSVFVDYAHTPDAVAIATSTARELAGSGMVIVVVGAGGDRDPQKRPEMGRAAADGADIVVVTSDNPRGEDPRAIADAVAAGVGPSAMIILDRRAAIAAALDRAGVGDVVLVAGKGHETTQTVGDEIVPFDDRQVVAELLVERGW